MADSLTPVWAGFRGTAATVVLEGDSRLTDARTPTAHATSHQNNGSDEISVAGLSGLLADSQTPLAHATSHKSGGSDAIKLDELAAPTDVTTLNASTSAHGLCPKGSNGLDDVLVGDVSYDPLTSSNPVMLVPPTGQTANVTATLLMTSGFCLAIYLGRATRAMTSWTVKYRVTTAATTITWAEVAIAKGPLVPTANATLTVVGYSDESTPMASGSLKSATITITGGQTVSRGDDLWLVIGCAATVPPTIRVYSVPDNLATGAQQGLAVQPSTIVGTPTAFTIEAVGNQGPWCMAFG